VATLIATSASGRSGDFEEGGATIEKGRLAFVLPDAGRAVTYAAGEGAENGADNDLPRHLYQNYALVILAVKSMG
jgi:hypothetical protein